MGGRHKVIAARWGMLLLASLSMLAALGAFTPDVQPSALRTMVTAVVGMLAPLFWPGAGPTVARTAGLVVAWSAASAGTAAMLLQGLGHPGQPLARTLGSCAMLMLMLLVVHALVATLDWRWRGQPVNAQSSGEVAGRVGSVWLALLGSLPLWLGPASELLSSRHVWMIDTVVGLSPLTHLAVAAGNDLLRNQWFYQHSNLAALQYAYPGLAELAWGYAAACVLLALIALAFHRQRRPVADAAHPCLSTEKAK